MQFWISAFVFILTFGIGECETSHRSIFLMTNESIIGIDPESRVNHLYQLFKHKISRNPRVDTYEFSSFKAVVSSSKELRAVYADSIISFDLSDTENIKQKVMFNVSTYPVILPFTDAEDFYLERNYITGMTVDPITSSTYFTTSSLISVMNSGGKFRTLIEFDENDEPVNAISDICLISSQSRLYWLSNRTSLYSAFTDGSDIKKLNVNLLRIYYTKMVADENKKFLYLLSESDQITVVNTINMESDFYRRDVRSIAVDSETGDVFITEFDTIKERLFLKKFEPYNGPFKGKSSFYVNLRNSPPNHSLVVHRKDENWTECKDCDGICLRKSDRTTICECPQDLIRDQESGKCYKPKQRVLYLSKENRIISLSWPDDTTKHSINFAGKTVEFKHFAFDHISDLIFGTTFDNEIWNFSPDGTFIARTKISSDYPIMSMDVDVVTGNLVVMTKNNATRGRTGRKQNMYENLCTIRLYGPYFEKEVILIHQHLACSEHLEVDERNGKIFFTSKEGIQSANMNGKDIKLLKDGENLSFSLHKWRRNIFYKRRNENDIYCVDYIGYEQPCSVQWTPSTFLRFKFVNEKLYFIDEEKKMHWADLHTFDVLENMTLIDLSLNESTIGIKEVSQRTPSTACSIENGGCEYLCIISNRKKQCLCKRKLLNQHGKCKNHTQFLVFRDGSDITIFNPDKETFQPRKENIRKINSTNPLLLTFDYDMSEFYFSNKSGIFSIPSFDRLDGKDCTKVVKIDGLATGLAMDVSNQELYFINNNKYQIMKVNLETDDRTLTVVYESKNKEDVFSHLQYDECTESLYFSNNNKNGASIESYKLEESGHSTIVRNLDFVNGLAIDRKTRHIYYSHLERKQITRCFYNGKFSENLMDVYDNQSYYGDIAILNDDLIYLHNDTEFVAVHKNDVKDKRTILKDVNSLFLAAVDLNQVECLYNPCLNNDLQCSELCLPKKTGEAVCTCHRPKVLRKDGKTCGFPKCSEWCLNRSFCASMNATHIECKCQPGYYGERCDRTTGVINDCMNGGVIDHGKACRCSKGFGIWKCTIKTARNCDSLDCLNGGKCIQTLSFSPRCNCIDGFWGENCAYHNCTNYCDTSAKCSEALLYELPYCECDANMYGPRCNQHFEEIPLFKILAVCAFNVVLFAILIWFNWNNIKRFMAPRNQNVDEQPGAAGERIPMDTLGRANVNDPLLVGQDNEVRRRPSK